jgi:ketosteroid isomerase-like protein
MSGAAIRTQVIAEVIMAAVNAREADRIEVCTTDDVELLLPPRHVYNGHTGIEDFLSALARRLPHVLVVTDQRYCGNDFAVLEWEAESESGERFLQTVGCVVFCFRGELVNRIHLYLDTELWDALGDD